MFSTRIEHYLQLENSMELAKKRGLEGEPEGLVIWADEITHAMGRQGRRWIAKPGGLWISILLRPRIDFKKIPLFNYLAPTVVLETLNSFLKHTRAKPSLKWPNDIVIGEKNQKIAGLLTWAEGRMEGDDYNLDFLIWGMGINVANPLPPYFEYHGKRKRENIATSLQEWNPNGKVEDLLFMLLHNLERKYLLWQESNYLEKGIQKIADQCSTLGKKVRLYEKEDLFVEGVAKRIDPPTGKLVLEVEGKERSFLVGDCFHLDEQEP